MGRPQYEDRVTLGGIVGGGITRAEAAASARTLPGRQYAETRGPEHPVLPPLHATRSASSPHTPPHAAMTGTHIHEHHDYGQGTPPAPGQRLGIHIHEHTHRGDASHSPGGSHPHRVSHTPGNPDATMPNAQLNSSPAPGETRDDVSGIGLGEQIARFLASQGVDVAAALADAQYAREHAGQRAQATAGRASDLAGALRRAKRRTELAQEAWRAGWSGSSWHEVCQMREAQADAEAELRECCLNDPALVSAAKRAAR
jgi:hypothetical protein